MKRFRFKQDKALGERLIKEARLAREKTEQLLPPGEAPEDRLKKVRQAETAVHIDDCATGTDHRSKTGK
jgi:hypothetical protein